MTTLPSAPLRLLGRAPLTPASLALTVLLANACVLAPPARAQHVTVLTPIDLAADAQFGYDVAIDGDYAVIGAPRDSGNAYLSGAAYVFRRDGWTWIQEAKLTASDGATSDYFGRSVAIDGDYVIVGASDAYGNAMWSGAVYVFHHAVGTWAQEAKLNASDGASGDAFGSSVAISGERVVGGAWRDDDHGLSSGAAYVFRREGETWTEEAKLTASDSAELDYFAWRVDISGDVVVAGAHKDDDNGPGSGSAYVFRRQGESWVEEAKLRASDGVDFDQFGHAVAVSGDLIVVGAPQEGEGDRRDGSAYVFRRDGQSWVEEVKLRANDGRVGDHFAKEVAADGDRVVASAPDDEHGGRVGSAYVFRRSSGSWDREAKLTTSDEVGHYGWSIAVSGEAVVIGAPSYIFTDDGNGSAYVYEPTAVPTEGVATPVAATLATPRPNPSSGPTVLTFELPRPSAVRLAVFDALGREVALLLDGTVGAGSHAVTLDASRLAPGVYVARLASGDDAVTRRLVVTR